MAQTTPPRLLRLLFWIALSALAAYGLILLGLVVAGMIQFIALECGPRHGWTEANYSACSDIDETNSIFFRSGLPAILPLTLALLIRAIRRQILRNRAYLS